MTNILIVEDDPNTSRALTARLSADGHHAHPVGTCWAALNAASNGRFDLFIVDIGLPDGDGLSLGSRLLTIPGAQSTPIIFLTGNGELGARLAASKLGVCGWVDKPYRPELLQEAVRVALGGRETINAGLTRFSPLCPMLPSSPGQLRPKILVIEDDRRLASALQRRFENAGYHVATAHSGGAGLRAAIDSRPDAILSDIYMPGGLGFTIIEKLANNGLPEIPVFFLTASKRPNLKQTAIRMGAAGFFEKPCDSGELLRAVRRTVHAQN